MSRALPPAPAYGSTGLAGVLPQVAGTLGVSGFTPAEPAVRSAVVVLIDGLGEVLLRRRSGYAPFLRSLLADGAVATAGFPSTTATSMGSFGTGLPPGSHGLVGYQVRDPGSGRLFNELSWENGPDPRSWQPQATVFERCAADGVNVTMVANDYFEGSGLTTAALRGAGFATDAALGRRVDLTLELLRRRGRNLVYLYWGNLDRVGHESGCESWKWCDELELIDAELRRLAVGLPRGTSLTITADHGMVDVPFEQRIDVADDPELDDGVEVVGGEMRSLQLYCRPGAAADVLATWTERVGERGWVVSLEAAVAAGWFGPVRRQVLPRLGDVIVAMDGPYAYLDSRVMPQTVGRLLGQHGSLTEAEQAVPVLRFTNV
ncbi:alkaline phosphatase family protein [Calidifontibacter terrae]